MQVTEVNDIKTYNLSHGKSLPEWLSDRKRRLLLKKNIDIRRRIQLIQDFEMPTLSNTIDISNDEQYIIVSGIYKPRIRCFDVEQLGMKFERCLDNEVIKTIILSDDYSKLLLLQTDRWIELHSQSGYYFKTRIPKFGRDITYNKQTCDALFVGNSSEIYRLNLNVGTFLKSYETDCEQINTIDINPIHNLICVGSQNMGIIEAWDPRIRERVGKLNCSNELLNNYNVNNDISITKLKFYNSLTMAVGTSMGQILLYDIRSNRSYLKKDHYYGIPINSIEFINNGSLNLCLTLDKKILKIWHMNDYGKPFTAVQNDYDFNQLKCYPNSGLIFITNDSTKILTYFIPTIGPAPKWCSFLDRITEELEETNNHETTTTNEFIYDDYKFITETELNELGLSELIGTNLLRSHLHGYFIDNRLYEKTKKLSKEFIYQEYKQNKILEKYNLQFNNNNRVKLPIDDDDQDSDLPKINRKLAKKLLDEQNQNNSNNINKPNILNDERFNELFNNPDFEIDETSDEYRLLNPVLNNKKQKQNNKINEIENDQLKKIDIDNIDDENTDDSDEELFKYNNDDDEEDKDEEEDDVDVDEDNEEDEYDDDEDERDGKDDDVGDEEIKNRKSFNFKLIKQSENDENDKNVDDINYLKQNISLEKRLKLIENKKLFEVVDNRNNQLVGGNRIMTFTINNNKNQDKKSNNNLNNNKNNRLINIVKKEKN